jgi:hypothetical protein
LKAVDYRARARGGYARFVNTNQSISLVHSLSRVDIGTMSAKRSHALIELRVRQAPEASHEAKRTSTNYRRHASPGRLKSSTSIVY